MKNKQQAKMEKDKIIKKQSSLYKRLILVKGTYGFPILDYPQWIKFVWTENKSWIDKKLVYTIHAIEILILGVVLFFLIVAWILTST